MTARSVLIVAWLGFLAGPQLPSARVPDQAPGSTTPASAIAIDVVPLDRDGRFVENLRPGDFTVTVNGTRRRVLSVRGVSRGPGAMAEAASRQASGDETIAFAAEPARTVLVVVDQATLARGDERGIVQAAGAFLDRIGLHDRVAVLRIPMSSDVRMTLTTERPEAGEVLSRVVGQATPAPADLGIEPSRDLVVEPDRVTGGDPDKAVRAERQDPTSAALAPEAPADVDPRSIHDSLGALRAICQALG